MSDAVPLAWVTAFRGEASGLIDHYQLKRVTGAPLEFYESRDGVASLIVTGPGRVASAGGVGWLGGILGASARNTLWLNFGTAGGNDGSEGQCFRANRIGTRGGRVHYPQTSVKGEARLPGIAVETVDEPTRDYPKDALVEMEAVGFWETALRWTTVEWIQVIKVVSDTPGTPWSEATPKLGSRFCSEVVPQVAAFAAASQVALAPIREDSEDPEGFSEVLALARFTSTESHRLRQLLNRISARSLTEVMLESCRHRKTEGPLKAPQLLKEIESILWE
ncbi:MAG: hypothetical protein AAF236_12985 [Verrucomicrobiota bacterium]